MQKTDLIRRKKWAMEEAFLREVGVKNGSTSMRSWDEDWEINTQNRERPGGIQTTVVRGWDGFRKSKFIKRKSNKKARREHVRITAEAVREFYEDHELYLQEMAALYDEFWDDMIAYDDLFWDDLISYDDDCFWDDTLESEMDVGSYDYDTFWYDPEPPNSDMAIHIYKAYTGKDI